MADKRAEGALMDAGTTLKLTRVAFDVAYRKLIAVSKGMLGDGFVTRVFQRFVRSNGSDVAEEASEAIPSAESTPSEAETGESSETTPAEAATAAG